jgi:hypothetical protein
LLFEFLWLGTGHDQKQIGNRGADGHLLGNGDQAGHRLARTNAVKGRIDHRVYVLGDDDTSMGRCPGNNSPVGLSAKSDAIYREQIDFRDAPAKAAGNAGVEVLVRKQRDHVPDCLAA